MGHPQSFEVERVSCGPPAQIHSYHPSFPRLLIFSLFKVSSCQKFPSYICAGQYQLLQWRGELQWINPHKFCYHAQISFWHICLPFSFAAQTIQRQCKLFRQAGQRNDTTYEPPTTKIQIFLFFGRNRNWNWQMLTTGIVNGDLNNGMSWSFKISKPLLTCLQRECPGRLHLKYCELSRHFPSHSQTEGEGEMKPSQKPLYVLFSKLILTWEASLSPSGILTQGFHIYEIEG